MSTAYELAVRQGDDVLRTTLLDAASRLLAAEGPHALTMRRISHEVGCSTTVLYRMFGGKDGLAEALYVEGFARFRARLVAVPADQDPRLRLAAMGRAYLANARSESNYYGLMFGRPLPGFEPGPDATAHALETFDVLRGAVADCGAAGHLPEDADPVQVAELLWATMHGIVGLDLAGLIDDAGGVLETAIAALGRGLLFTPLTE
ncbi:TetR/AcrR family transcriptional regulator [Actinomadura flavalba]|uniref:TetR/AcrR family transcriptional regulator n=1 Tax=Actinomadura flavalba TaxID=1120938 RepID=UPI000373A8A0|nr:TetR/AcrR family transcriptional regulator [Actinomadura flavalba]